MILFGVELPRFALPIAAGAAVTLVALDVFGRHTPPSAWRLPPPVAPECKVLLSPNHGPTRLASSLRGVILHSTESASASSAANWFADPKSKVSAHIVAGETECFRCVPDLVVAWAAGPTNDRFLQLEIVGYAKWSRAEWLQRPGTLARARAQIAAWCAMYGFPNRFLGAAALKSDAKGISTHFEVTKAYSGGSGHWDPGANFPRDAVGVAGYGPRPFEGLVGALLAA